MCTCLCFFVCRPTSQTGWGHLFAESVSPWDSGVSFVLQGASKQREKKFGGGGGRHIWHTEAVAAHRPPARLPKYLSVHTCLPICLCVGVVCGPDSESAAWWWMTSGFRHADGRTDGRVGWHGDWNGWRFSGDVLSNWGGPVKGCSGWHQWRVWTLLNGFFFYWCSCRAPHQLLDWWVVERDWRRQTIVSL